MRRIVKTSLAAFALLLCVHVAVAQCMNFPVALEQRVINSANIAMGKVESRHCYKAADGGINTLNKMQVKAWLKNAQPTSTIYIITLGGVLGGEATIVTPALEFDNTSDYIVMLQGNSNQYDDKQFRLANPGVQQLLPYAEGQGAMLYQDGFYNDMLVEPKRNEQETFARFAALTNQAPVAPNGIPFLTRSFSPPVASYAISNWSPTVNHAGTVDPAEFLQINGSGFGATADFSSVNFKNGNDGGATYISVPYESDIVSWADNAVKVKIPSQAGTGTFQVGNFTSSTSLNISYSLLSIYSQYLNYPVSTRFRYHLRNLDGAGGYTVYPGASFLANSNAFGAFSRSVQNWRCNTFVNWKVSSTASENTAIAADSECSLLFVTTLPAGVLGRTTSRFLGQGTNGVCDMANTVWWLREFDMEYPTTINWQYGPSNPSLNQYDFESVTLHELGHAHGLAHVINTSQVMHYSIGNGANRRVLSGTDIAAGSVKMGYSTAATCFNPGNAGTPMEALVPGTCLLPVSITSFTGSRNNSTTNILSWATAQEMNNIGFTIQRSPDGLAYTNLGFIASQPSSGKSNYQYEDKTAGSSAWYYRLQHTDADGRIKNSGTVYIAGQKLTGIKVWAGTHLGSIFINTPKAGTVQIWGANGQLNQTKNVKQGLNEISVTGLTPGVYFYRVQAGQEIITGKLPIVATGN